MHGWSDRGAVRPGRRRPPRRSSGCCASPSLGRTPAATHRLLRRPQRSRRTWCACAARPTGRGGAGASRYASRLALAWAVGRGLPRSGARESRPPSRRCCRCCPPMPRAALPSWSQPRLSSRPPCPRLGLGGAATHGGHKSAQLAPPPPPTGHVNAAPHATHDPLGAVQRLMAAACCLTAAACTRIETEAVKSSWAAMAKGGAARVAQKAFSGAAGARARPRLSCVWPCPPAPPLLRPPVFPMPQLTAWHSHSQLQSARRSRSRSLRSRTCRTSGSARS